jgi:hypothetical protein
MTTELHESSLRHARSCMKRIIHGARILKQKSHNMATARKQTAAVVVLALAIEEESNKIRKRRRFCCKSWLQRRDRYSDETFARVARKQSRRFQELPANV